MKGPWLKPMQQVGAHGLDLRFLGFRAAMDEGGRFGSGLRVLGFGVRGLRFGAFSFVRA